MKRWYLLFFSLVFFFPHAVFGQKVLVELFNNFDCQPCKEADFEFDQFLQDNPQLEIVRISIHNKFPDAKDPFYLDSYSSVDPRNSFYNVGTDPTGIINGASGAQSEQNWEAYCQSKALLGAPIAMDAHLTADHKISIHFKNTVPVTTPVHAYVMLTESNITKANVEAEGVPNSKVWDDIFRATLPTVNGYGPFTATGSDEFTYIYDFDSSQLAINGDPWNIENMRAVAFLQDDQAQGGIKKVEALGTVSLAHLALESVSAPSAPGPTLQLTTLTSPGQAAWTIFLPAAANIRLALYDMLGREVRVLADGRKASGESSGAFPATGLPAGCYIARLTVDGQELAHTKAIVQ